MIKTGEKFFIVSHNLYDLLEKCGHQTSLVVLFKITAQGQKKLTVFT